MKNLYLILSFVYGLNTCYAQRRVDYPTALPDNITRYYEGSIYWSLAYDSPSPESNTLKIYTDDVSHCAYPVYVVIDSNASDEEANSGHSAGFYSIRLPGLYETFMDYCRIIGWGEKLRTAIWEYRAMYVRLNNCSSGVSVNFEFSLRQTTPFLFRGTKSMESIILKYDHKDVNEWDGGRISEGVCRDCPDLKYAKFSEQIRLIDQDAFLNCPKLEVVEFESVAPGTFYAIYQMFNTNYDKTGSDYYPNLKAFVVPDNERDMWEYNLRFACKGIEEGRVKVITKSEFDAPRVTGVTINQSRIIIKN